MVYGESQVTLKMTTVQVVETSVSANSLSKDYPHLDNHTSKKKTAMYFYVVGT